MKNLIYILSLLCAFLTSILVINTPLSHAIPFYIGMLAGWFQRSFCPEIIGGNKNAAKKTQ
jgi:hypothetical protein